MVELSKKGSSLQYYYKANGCQAKSAYEPNCICWYNIGEGPFPDLIPADNDNHPFWNWRFK